MSDIVERLRELEGQTGAFAKNQHHSFVTTQQMARESADACREAADTIADLVKALEEARSTILDLKNARGSEAEGADEEWVSDIDAALLKARGETR